MVTEILDIVNDVITGLMTNIGTLLTSVGGLFYEAESGLTIVGILSVFALGTSLVFWGIRFVKNLIPKSK